MSRCSTHDGYRQSIASVITVAIPRATTNSMGARSHSETTSWCGVVILYLLKTCKPYPLLNVSLALPYRSEARSSLAAFCMLIFHPCALVFGQVTHEQNCQFWELWVLLHVTCDVITMCYRLFRDRSCRKNVDSVSSVYTVSSVTTSPLSLVFPVTTIPGCMETEYGVVEHIQYCPPILTIEPVET